MEDYNKLKNEAKQYAQEGRNNFIEMAVRLKAIKDGKLFKQDNYKGFNHFIKHELPVSRRTVYNYINIVEHIGTEPFTNNPNFDQSKVIPLFPLLNSKNEGIPKEDIKNEIIEDINKGKSAADVKAKIDTYKFEYNLKKEKANNNSSLLLSDNEISFDGEMVLEFSESINDETRQLILNALKSNSKIMEAIQASIEQTEDDQTIFQDHYEVITDEYQIKLLDFDSLSENENDENSEIKEAQ